MLCFCFCFCPHLQFLMSRLRRLALAGRIFFITTHILPTALPLTPAECDAILSSLETARHRRKFALLGYLMMPNHLHILFAPLAPDTLSNVLREIKISAAKRILAARKASGAFWQPRSFDRIIRTRDDFDKALLYIHLNPVTANLVDDPSKWRWSSWFGWNPSGAPPLPIDKIEWPITG